MSLRRRFDYHQFLTKIKLYIFETVSAAIVIAWLLEHAAKEIWPSIHQFWHFLVS